MKLGFASLIGVEPMPFADLVQWSADHAFDALEVNVGMNFPTIGDTQFHGHLDIHRIAQEGPGEVGELIAKSGVEISSLAPMINLLSADLELRARRIAEFKVAIDACQKLGVDTIVTFTGSSYGMSFLRTSGRRRWPFVEPCCRQPAYFQRGLRTDGRLRRRARCPDRL